MRIVYFLRLYKNGELYYATEYLKGCTGKRNNSICAFTDRNGEVKFGQINVFILDTFPMVLLLPYKTSSESLMRMARHCCRTVLEPHKEVDMLSS